MCGQIYNEYRDNEMKKDGLFNLKQYSKPLLFLG